MESLTPEHFETAYWPPAFADMVLRALARTRALTDEHPWSKAVDRALLDRFAMELESPPGVRVSRLAPLPSFYDPLTPLDVD